MASLRDNPIGRDRMRGLILQVAIDTAALLVSLLVFSLISVPQPFPFGGSGTAVPIVNRGRLGRAIARHSVAVGAPKHTMRPGRLSP